MDTAQFIDRTDAILPGTRCEVPGTGLGDELFAFSFVSRAFVPGYVEALDELAAGDPQALDRVRALSSLMEAAFVEGDGDLVDALAMRVVERHLCRDSPRARIASGHLGAATLEVVTKFRALIDSAERRVAAVADGDRRGGQGAALPRG